MKKWIRMVVMFLVAFSLFGCSITVNGCQAGLGESVHQYQSGPVRAGGGMDGETVILAVFGLLALLILVLLFAAAGGTGVGPGGWGV